MTDHRTEHAALVALLRTRPDKLAWRKLTDRVFVDGAPSTFGTISTPNPYFHRKTTKLH